MFFYFRYSGVFLPTSHALFTKSTGNKHIADVLSIRKIFLRYATDFDEISYLAVLQSFSQTEFNLSP